MRESMDASINQKKRIWDAVMDFLPASHPFNSYGVDLDDGDPHQVEYIGPNLWFVSVRPFDFGAQYFEVEDIGTDLFVTEIDQTTANEYLLGINN